MLLLRAFLIVLAVHCFALSAHAQRFSPAEKERLEAEIRRLGSLCKHQLDMRACDRVLEYPTSAEFRRYFGAHSPGGHPPQGRAGLPGDHQSAAANHYTSRFPSASLQVLRWRISQGLAVFPRGHRHLEMADAGEMGLRSVRAAPSGDLRDA